MDIKNKINITPLICRGEKFNFLPQQNLPKERDIWYKIKLIYSVLIKKISSLLSVGYYKSNNENQFKDIQLQLHATNVTNPYTFSIQGNMNFSGVCKSESYVIAYGSEPWYYSSWKDASKVSDLTTINGGAKFSVKNATNTSSMFYYCSKLTSLDLSNFDTSNVTNMNEMFEGCNKLTTLDISNFDTSKVKDMQDMFGNCSSLTTIKGIIEMKSCKYYMDMFDRCPRLTDVKIKNPPVDFESKSRLSKSQYTIVS